MNAPARGIDWTAANQRLLVAEFARLRALLGEGDAGNSPADLQALRAAMPAPAAIDTLARLFQLSAFERDVLLLAAGVEMDAVLAKRCAEAHGSSHRTYATFGLALGALGEPHWDALTPVRPLRRWRLVEIDERDGLANARLRIDERVLHCLAGVDYLDQRLQPLLRRLAPPRAMAQSHRQISDAVADALGNDPNRVVTLSGDDRDGQVDVATCVADAMGMQIYVGCADDLPQASSELDAFAVLWQREAILSGLALLFEFGSTEMSRPVIRLADRMGGLILLAGREPPALTRPALAVSINKPNAQEQKQLWERALGPAAQRLNGSLNAVATQFRLGARTILSKGGDLRAAILDSAEPDAVLWSACRGLVRPRLEELAQRITPAAAWDDLILPEPQQATLRQIAAQVRQRLKVYDDWGFAAKGARGLGISALFAGESGTGKTMAAEVLANALHLDLYRIDLSAVVSKYIGETEKNLRRVFDAAEDGGAILLFDEADALFGKRSEVKDSHDRYANIEVSYLLQRMEAYSGLAVLTTNHKEGLDSAFQRRLRFVVHFPFPDARSRERIWRSVFPADVPLGGIDYAKLARLNVAGGTIRNIALSAAFLAAGANTPLGMPQLLRASHLDAAKRDKPYSDAETRGWV